MSAHDDKTRQHQRCPPDEVTTSMSYYLLYQQFNKSLPPFTDNEGLWHEDTWTEQDFVEAERILKDAQERCNVQQQQQQQQQLAHNNMALCKDWNTFYQQHETKFFKDRHYLQQAFPQEMNTTTPSTLVEVGCGVGNALLPLLLLQDGWTVWGLDYSTVAIHLLKQQERFIESKGRAHAHVWDISQPIYHDNVMPWLGVANVTTLLFCLSALDPNDMNVAAHNVAATLQPGGTLLFRDYGRYDEAQLKLGTSRGKRLGENYYRKQDGTRVYYFALEDLERLFVQEAGLEVLELKYIRRVYYNRGTGDGRRRVWVHGRFRKAEKHTDSI